MHKQRCFLVLPWEKGDEMHVSMDSHRKGEHKVISDLMSEVDEGCLHGISAERSSPQIIFDNDKKKRLNVSTPTDRKTKKSLCGEKTKAGRGVAYTRSLGHSSFTL